MQKINIAKENLECHPILFIKDVKSSTYNSDQDCFQLAHFKLSIRKARLNGIVVDKKALDSSHHFWLDDSTSVIRAILPSEMLNRRNGHTIDIGTNITIFGQIQRDGDENMILCGGFKIEEDCVSEIYHWLKVIQDRPTQQITTPHNMFYSLSSYPSPNRLLDANFMQSPVEELDARNTKYLWSPNHKFATSTPIKIHQQHIMHQSPLRPTVERDTAEEFDDMDDFDNIDFSLIESNAINELSTKRKRSIFEE